MSVKHKIKRMTGNSGIVTTINKLIENDEANTPFDSATIKVERRTPKGFSLTANIPKASAQSIAAGMVFRGEWDSGQSYSPGDVVVIRDGASSGSYVCISSAPAGSPAPAYPAAGVQWVNLSPGNILGTWL